MSGTTLISHSLREFEWRCHHVPAPSFLPVRISLLSTSRRAQWLASDTIDYARPVSLTADRSGSRISMLSSLDDFGRNGIRMRDLAVDSGWQSPCSNITEGCA